MRGQEGRLAVFFLKPWVPARRRWSFACVAPLLVVVAGLPRVEPKLLSLPGGRLHHLAGVVAAETRMLGLAKLGAGRRLHARGRVALEGILPLPDRGLRAHDGPPRVPVMSAVSAKCLRRRPWVRIPSTTFRVLRIGQPIGEEGTSRQED
ncbi:hypothetical protein Cob_v008045 [Colletotrichum orbiculare MAFF 240422]|uniref:Uncharacterized protein n=1 Tax=Colletotrichum orbiculare (strain 104-T / ATCC 96160 / CBS 514.97 / LARS 414 / MAFF 240422) TaxID=1213857 RepID=A0A484FL54_COLOR|nr:hypothetical protein Cob_v008045 [Colletotrichum orbiculare MAFF 240422]